MSISTLNINQQRSRHWLYRSTQEHHDWAPNCEASAPVAARRFDRTLRIYLHFNIEQELQEVGNIPARQAKLGRNRPTFHVCAIAITPPTTLNSDAMPVVERVMGPMGKCHQGK